MDLTVMRCSCWNSVALYSSPRLQAQLPNWVETNQVWLRPSASPRWSQIIQCDRGIWGVCTKQLCLPMQNHTESISIWLNWTNLLLVLTAQAYTQSCCFVEYESIVSVSSPEVSVHGTGSGNACTPPYIWFNGRRWLGVTAEHTPVTAIL